MKRIVIETSGLVLMGIGMGQLVGDGALYNVGVVLLGLTIFQRPTSNYMPKGGSLLESLLKMWTGRHTGDR